MPVQCWVRTCGRGFGNIPRSFVGVSLCNAGLRRVIAVMFFRYVLYVMHTICECLRRLFCHVYVLSDMCHNMYHAKQLDFEAKELAILLLDTHVVCMR